MVLIEYTPEQRFGELAWQLITSRPFSTTNKRDLELSILHVAADAGMIDEMRPADVSATLRLSLIKTHGYLADLS